MKRLYITFLTAILCAAAQAQLNLQVHYDLIFRLSQRSLLT